MSEQRTPQAAIEGLESAVFRAGQLARRLIADLPATALQDIRTHCHSNSGLYGRTKVSVELTAEDLDGARQIADQLGLDLSCTTHNVSARSGSFEHAHAETEIDGVCVSVTGIRLIDPDEWEATQPAGDLADSDTPAEGGEQR